MFETENFARTNNIERESCQASIRSHSPELFVLKMKSHQSEHESLKRLTSAVNFQERSVKILIGERSTQTVELETLHFGDRTR